MVRIDESNIDFQWLCPPCEKLNPKKVTTAPPETINEADGDIAQNIDPPIEAPKSPDPITSEPEPNLTSSAPLVVSPTMPVVSSEAIKMSKDSYKYVSTVNGTTNKSTPPGRLNFPDIKIRDLPFYPVKATLLRPCAIVQKDTQETQSQNLAFYLTQEQAETVNKGRRVENNGMVVYKMHILLRFTKMDVSAVQDDDFPKNLCLKVNNKICPLPNPKPVPSNRPNMEAKRPPKPLIITSLCKLNTKSCLNQVSVSWSPVPDASHTVSIYLVEKLSPSDLLKQLVGRGQRDPEITKALIRSKLEDKCEEIATSCCKVSLGCPLGMVRMSLPCRASTCDHLQCFDADLFLRMNEKKPKWICPVCNKTAYFEHLFLDGYYIQLLQSSKLRAITENDILLNADASWEPVLQDNNGVSADSDDEDPLQMKEDNGVVEKNKKNGAEVVSGDVIPVEVLDDDGAPVRGSTAVAVELTTSEISTAIPNDVPVNIVPDHNNPKEPAVGTSVTATVRPEDDDDLLCDKVYPADEDYMDWNYSVKYFRFIREPPPQPKPTTPPPDADSTTVDEEGKSKNQSEESETSSKPASGNSSDVDIPQKELYKPKQSPAAKQPRGRGRGRGARGRPRGSGGGKRIRMDSSGDEVTSSSKQNGGSKPKRGRGRGRGRGARGRGASKAKTAKWGGDSSEDEAAITSESESEVLSRSAPSRTSGRPARNCRRSTNYAEIEKGYDHMDSDEFEQSLRTYPTYKLPEPAKAPSPPPENSPEPQENSPEPEDLEENNSPDVAENSGESGYE